MKWFCNMTMLDLMLQNKWKITWKCYSTHHLHQTLPHPIIICSYQWHFHSYEGAKKWVNSWWELRKCVLFINLEFKWCLNKGKSSGYWFLQIFENKALLSMKNQWKLIQSLSLSLSLYIYIYIYIYERERE